MSACDLCGSTRGAILPWVINNETRNACMSCRARHPQADTCEEIAVRLEAWARNGNPAMTAEYAEALIDAAAEVRLHAAMSTSTTLASTQAARIVELERMIEAQEQLLVACRLGRRPSDKTLDTIAKFKATTARIAESKKESET